VAGGGVVGRPDVAHTDVGGCPVRPRAPFTRSAEHRDLSAWTERGADIFAQQRRIGHGRGTVGECFAHTVTEPGPTGHNQIGSQLAHRRLVGGRASATT
jgi:hypothetical protein